MGGQGSGRRVDRARRQVIAELLAQGLSQAEVGRRLGLSRQHVHFLLHSPGPGAAAVPCPRCGRVAIPAGAPLRETPGACPACLARRAGTEFREVLRAYRLAAGLTQADLAGRAGLHPSAVNAYERGRHRPKQRVLVRLARVLGPGLATLGETRTPPQRPRADEP